MIWALVIANIVGTSLCLWSTNILVKIATVRINLIAPLIIVVVCLGAYQATKSFSDLVVLIIISLLGWVMKRLGWPRPPLLLGLVLAGILENNFFISYHAYGVDWLARPVVIFSLLGCVLTIFLQVRLAVKKRRQKRETVGETKE
jgi:TctA family transporter